MSQLAVLDNPKHEKYVQNLVAGMSQRQAYLDAFPTARKWKPETVDNNASKLFRDEILTRYREVMEERKEEAFLTREKKRRILMEIAMGTDASNTDRIRAIDTDNKMEQAYRSGMDKAEQQAKIDLIKAQKEHLTGENETDESLDTMKSILEELRKNAETTADS